MTEKIPTKVDFICGSLRLTGCDAFVVGGAVRDLIMGRKPKDFDITTNASEQKIRDCLFGKEILEMGAAFGIFTVILDGEPFEIAQMRLDSKESDGRRPKDVKFVSRIEQDLARRDFTMNAMAIDPKTGKITDPFGGQKDIANKVINFVGNAEERIAEDKLRIFRAFRFMSQLGFTFSAETLHALTQFSGDFASVSQERITTEFEKILMGDNAFNTIKLMAELGFLQMIIPEMTALSEPHNNGFHTEVMAPFGNSIMAHVMFVFKFACEDDTCSGDEKLILRLGALLHDIGKPLCRGDKPDGTNNFHGHDLVSGRMVLQILTRMRFPKDIVNMVFIIVKNHMQHHDFGKMKKSS